MPPRHTRPAVAGAVKLRLGVLSVLLLLCSAGVVAQQCGEQVSFSSSCPGRQCCSVHGYCGETEQHCSVDMGCQEGCRQDWLVPCGDGVCGWDETCSTCPGDCGPCQRRGIVRSCVEDGTYALTFDDGPSNVTPQLLDTLSRLAVRATFFVVGDRIEWAAMETMQRAFREGHELASHSYSHPDLSRMSLADVRGEVANAAASIQRAVCVRPRIFRPPYGALTDEGLAMVEDMGYLVVNWNLDTLDHGLATGATTPAKLLAHVQEVMDDKHPGSIIHLQHDLLADSVALVEDVVRQVRAKGYRFVTVRECVYGTHNVTSNPSVQFEYKNCEGGYYSGAQGGGGTGGGSGDGSGSSVGDDAPPPEPEVCGNGKCLYPETCGNCVDDCGPCQTVGVGEITRQCLDENDWALTFDDGPSDVTDDLLDILRAKEAKASFFVVGNRISWSAAQFLQRAQSQGHYIASHSNTHKDFATLTLDQVREELVASDVAIQAAVCVRPRVLRPPYGSITPEVQELAESMGYRVVNWNLDTQDWRVHDPAYGRDGIYAQVQAAIQAGMGHVIHLQHDLQRSSVNTVGPIVDMVRAAGYNLVTLDKCVYGGDAATTGNPSLLYEQAKCWGAPDDSTGVGSDGGSSTGSGSGVSSGAGDGSNSGDGGGSSSGDGGVGSSSGAGAGGQDHQTGGSASGDGAGSDVAGGGGGGNSIDAGSSRSLVEQPFFIWLTYGAAGALAIALLLVALLYIRRRRAAARQSRRSKLKEGSRSVLVHFSSVPRMSSSPDEQPRHWRGRDSKQAQMRARESQSVSKHQRSSRLRRSMSKAASERSRSQSPKRRRSSHRLVRQRSSRRRSSSGRRASHSSSSHSPKYRRGSSHRRSSHASGGASRSRLRHRGSSVRRGSRHERASDSDGGVELSVRSRSHSPQLSPPQYVQSTTPRSSTLGLGAAAAALVSASKALEVRSASSVSIHGSVASARLGSGHSARNLFPEVHLPQQESDELLEVVPLAAPAPAPAPVPAAMRPRLSGAGLGGGVSTGSVSGAGGFVAALGDLGPRPGQKWRFALSASRASIGASSFGSANSTQMLLGKDGDNGAGSSNGAGVGGGGSGAGGLLRHNASQLQRHHQFYAQQLHAASSLGLAGSDHDARFYNRTVYR